MARWASALGGRGLYTQHGGRHSAGRPARRGLGLGGCHPGSLWGHPRSAACVTRRMLGCRTDPIVKTIEHCFGGFPRFGCRVAISRPPPAARTRGTGHASRPSTRIIRGVAQATMGRRRRQARASILSVPRHHPLSPRLCAHVGSAGCAAAPPRHPLASVAGRPLRRLSPARRARGAAGVRRRSVQLEGCRSR